MLALLLIFALLIPSNYAFSDEELVLTGLEVCNAYQGFEHQYNCGQNGYFIGYGSRYCRRFFDKG